jgi:aminoglycoside phosphotransferase (APT) family kinase protein
MEIPKELVRSPPPATLAWVTAQFGMRATVVRVRRLRNASAAAMHAIDVFDGERRHHLVLRRWARTDVAPDPGVVETECAALALLGSFEGLPVPRLVAADPTGEAADVPAVLMTRLDGIDMLDPSDVDAFVDGLVHALHCIHAIPVPPDVLGPYQPWNCAFTEPPPWSAGPDAWERAIAIAREPLPGVPTVLCHRDFWPGNVLWHSRTVSGVVDWTHACNGPAAVDVAHCRENLAMLFGLDVADDFAERYGPVPELARFDVREAMSWSIGPGDMWRWHDAGRTDLTFDILTARVDEYVTAAVNRLP